MLYERHFPNSCPLFRKRSLKKINANFRVDFAPFLQLTFSLVDSTHFLDLMF